MAAHPRNEASRTSNEVLSLGPDCAVLTSIGTVYLYRLTQADVRAYGELPDTHSASEKFRSLLARIASASVSDKGAAAAGPLKAERIQSLNGDEVERLAEAYLESSIARWYGQDAASPAPRREPRELATAYLDRLIHWHASPSGSPPPERVALAPPPAPEPRANPRAARGERLAARTSRLALLSLSVLSAAAIAVAAQGYLAMQGLERRHDELAARLREVSDAQAQLAAQAARLAGQNADLGRRIASLDNALRAQAQAQAQPVPKAREARPRAQVRSPTQRTPLRGDSRPRTATRLR